MRSCIAWFASIAIVLTGAAALAGDAVHRALVPWKVIEPGAETEDVPLTLFWVPSSPEEVRRSDLLQSDELTLYSSHCVAMRIVRMDDYALLERLGIRDEVPAVVLADAEGQILGRTDSSSVEEVEAVVREALHDRADTAEQMLDEAAGKAEAGDVDEAISIYRKVWAQRCECPRQGKTAGKALKRLER
jgi:hypothetical protein